MRAEKAKNKFSEIALASSKGISSKDPNNNKSQHAQMAVKENATTDFATTHSSRSMIWSRGAHLWSTRSCRHSGAESSERNEHI